MIRVNGVTVELPSIAAEDLVEQIQQRVPYCEVTAVALTDDTNTIIVDVWRVNTGTPDDEAERDLARDVVAALPDWLPDFAPSALPPRWSETWSDPDVPSDDDVWAQRLEDDATYRREVWGA